MENDKNKFYDEITHFEKPYIIASLTQVLL